MIVLVHHGHAVDAAVEPQRPLSEIGHGHAERLARRARGLGVKPEAVWHSGKMRARQTAEPFWRECNPLAEFSAVRGLQPGDPPEWIRDVLQHDTRELVLVGHMPHLNRLLVLLLGGSASQFPLHGMVALDRRARDWNESWRDAGVD